MRIYPVVRFLRWLVSFELFFAFFIFSNALKFVLPPLPVDETLLSGALALVLAVPIVLREGIYMRGLITLVVYLTFVGYALCTWYWSPSRSIAITRLEDFLMIDLLAIVLGGMVLASSRARMARFLVFVSIFAVILAARGLSIYMLYGTFKFYQGFEEGVRVYNIWGYSISLGTVILFALATSSRLFSFKQLIVGTGLAMCMMFLLVASSRGALLCATTGILVFLAVNSPTIVRQRLQINQTQLIAFALILLAVAYVSYELATGGSFHTIGKFAKLLRQSENTAVVLGPNRFRYYSAAIELWIQAPVFGHGLGAFSILFIGAEMEGAHPHNFVLELLSDMGVVGLLLFLAFLWTGLRNMKFSQLRRDPLMVAALMLFTAAATQGMFSTDLAGLTPLYAFAAALNIRPKPLQQHTPGSLPNIDLARLRVRPPIAAMSRIVR